MQQTATDHPSPASRVPNIAANALLLIVIVLSLQLVFRTVSYGTSGTQGPTPEPIRVTSVDVSVIAHNPQTDTSALPSQIDLPYNLRNASEGDVVTLSTTLPVQTDWQAYVATDYASFKVYANGTLIGEYGEKGSYSEIFDLAPPASLVSTIGHEAAEVELTVEYTVPAHYWGLRLKPILVGEYNSLRAAIYAQGGVNFFFGLAIFALGATLSVVSLMLLTYRMQSQIFMWLGVYCMFSGMWIFGECDLSSVIIQRPGLLHALTYIGFFGSCIPLTQLMRVTAEEAHSRIVDWMPVGASLFAAGALAFQLTGILSFSEMLLPFYTVMTIMYGYMTIATAVRLHHERAEGKVTRIAAAFFSVMVVFDTFLILEIANYYVLNWVEEMTFYLIASVLLTAFIAFLGAAYMRAALRRRNESAQMGLRLAMMRTRAEAERRQWHVMAESRAEVRRQRHDLRHQIAVIRALAESGKTDEIVSKLDTLDSRIPSGASRVKCDNFPVSAVAGYYLNRVVGAGIEDIDVRLDVPMELDERSEEDICAIVGNLLDNASSAVLEAAAAGAENVFIHMKGIMRGDTLFITMDNSYASVSQRDDGTFATTKRSGSGIGLESVAECAQRNSGAARFEADPQKAAFRSSVYLHVRRQQDGTTESEEDR